MNMVAGGVAGGAHLCYLGARFDRVTDIHQHAGAVGIKNLQAVAVVQADIVAVTVAGAGIHHHSEKHGIDRIAGIGGDIHTGMELPPRSGGIIAVAIAGGEHPLIHRQTRHQIGLQPHKGRPFGRLHSFGDRYHSGLVAPLAGGGRGGSGRGGGAGGGGSRGRG